MTREDAHLTATVAITIIFGAIVGAVITIVLSSLLTVEAMTTDFSLEHKFVETAP